MFSEYSELPTTMLLSTANHVAHQSRIIFLSCLPDEENRDNFQKVVVLYIKKKTGMIYKVQKYGLEHSMPEIASEEFHIPHVSYMI